MFYSVLQFVGGLILAVGYGPQIKTMVKTRSANDFNIKTFVMMMLGILLMEIYAIHLSFAQHAGYMFLATNTMSLMLAIAMVVLIGIYQNKKK